MPNWCENRVTASAGNEEEEKQLAELKQIFSKDNPFNVIYPQPDFSKIKCPDRNELPVEKTYKNPNGEYVHTTLEFSDGRQDDRWYNWRVQNWGTKWDISEKDIEWSDDHEDYVQFAFDTAWSPPEGIVSALREKFPELSISWFYDEPAMEFAGYL